MSVGETDAILGQLIDMRRTNVFGSLIAQVRPSEIIGQKNDGVRFFASLQSNCEAPEKEWEG